MNDTQASQLLSLVSDESRLKIIRLLLINKKMCGNDFLPYINCKQATLSHHMSCLCEANIVKNNKKGNKVFYSLNKQMLESLLGYILNTKTINKNIKDIKEDPDIVRDLKKINKKDDVPIFLL